MKKMLRLSFLLTILYGIVSVPLSAQNKSALTADELRSYWEEQYNQDQPKSAELHVLRHERIAKAEPDETYFGIGDPRNDFDPTKQHPTSPDGIAKTNQAYVWGMTQDEENIFFGTGPNILCIILGGYTGLTGPFQKDCYTCEFGQSQFSPPLPDAFGDWRPSQIFSYNTESGTQTELTPIDPLIQTTNGLRSAGSHDGVVIVAGQGFMGGINMFAFDAASNDYLGSYTLALLPGSASAVPNNIRKWKVVDGVMYLGIGTTEGGAILKWTGDISDPFQFETVGLIESQAAEIEVHNNKLFVTTWPSLASKQQKEYDFASIWMSPNIPAEGLDNSHAQGWEKVWSVIEYEPDPIIAGTYGGGALKSFDGYLYWGTMHVPFTSILGHFQTYPPQTLQDSILGVLGGYRATSLFRVADFGENKNDEVDLLYGHKYLPAYAPGYGWTMVENNMGQLPKYGPSGMWNLFNNYTWTMETYKNELFIGTMDMSYIAATVVPDLIGQAFSFPLKSGNDDTKTFGNYELPGFFFGADLFRVPNSSTFAIPVDISGLGNYLNYGIRTMTSNDDHLYMGTANPMNICDEGGWELIEAEQDTLIFDLKEFNIDLMTKNEPDETFYGIGDPRNKFDPSISHYSTDSTIAKHNQSYVWGMTAAEDAAWFGTGPNVLQLVMGAYLQMPIPTQGPSLVAEFGLSQFSPPWPDILGDWRPARVFKWDEETETRMEFTPAFEDAPLLQSTLGLRSAGTIGDLVILAGPNFAVDHFGVNFFAFNNETGEFLGSHQQLEILGDPINNIRKWITYEGESYTGISGEMYGYIIKWTGDLNDPFQYEVVGIIDAAPAEFTIHEGRLVTSCWPGGGELGSPTGGLPSVWYSPVIGSGGLTFDDRFGWKELWKSTDYEVDPVMARMMAGGAIQSFDGKLYWGSMHVPFMAAFAHLQTYFEQLQIEPTELDVINAVINCHRAISIFRADNLGEPNEVIELLYGEEKLPAYNPYSGWSKVPNASGYKPLYGPSGIGSQFNNYTWTMSVWDDQLFIGTMDWSYLIPELVPYGLEVINQAFAGGKFNLGLDDFYLFHLPIPFEGADLYRIGGSDHVAMPVSLNGMGNRRNYGIRTMASTPDKLYLGSANAMNLHPEGGWELYALTNLEADFIANKETANPGDYVTFYPEVDGFQLYNTSWYFEGGDPEYSSDKNPVVYYANPGKYDVELDVYKFGETISNDKDEYIEIVNLDLAQCMDFHEGWGAVSSYMVPTVAQLEILMDHMIHNPTLGEMVVMLGESGVFWPALNFNTLHNWNTYEGYKVKMTQINFNCLFGEPETTNSIELEAGLHYLPILSMEPVSANSLFSSAPVKFAYNLYNAELYWPEGGIYSLETLYPGIGYLVYLNEGHEFVFADKGNTPKTVSRMPFKAFENPTACWNDPYNSGRPQIISVYTDALQELNTTDVIGAFNEAGVCVGMSQVMNIRDNLGLIVYGDDNTTEEVDGLLDGESIIFKILEGKNNERRVYPEFDENMPYHNGKYVENGYSGIKSFKGSPTGVEVNEIDGLEIYPNPASTELNIVCPVQDSPAMITIYNTQGQVVIKSELTGMLSTFNISKLENGIYFVKIKSSDKIVVEQMIKK